MTCAASESPYPAAPRREQSASQTRCVTAMTELGDQPARLAKAAQRVNATDTDGVLPPHRCGLEEDRRPKRSMGNLRGVIIRACGQESTVCEGGSFILHLPHRDLCGEAKGVSLEERTRILEGWLSPGQ